MDKEAMAGILERAADLYESEKIEWCKRFWIKLDVFDQPISACAEGAIYLAAGLPATVTALSGSPSFTRGEFTDEYIRGNQAISVLADWLTLTHVYKWNDAEGRNKADVIEAMKNCAKDLRNEADPVL